MFTSSSDTESPGGNSGWNLEAGQSRENNFVYNAKIGESDVLNGMIYNIIKDKENFSYGSSLGQKEILIGSKFENIKVNIFDVENMSFNIVKLESQFLFCLIEDDSNHHILPNGRHRSIFKFKKSFKYHSFSNEVFYNEIDEIIGKEYPWFGIEINYYPTFGEDSNLLTFNIIKCKKDEKSSYIDSNTRKTLWKSYKKYYYQNINNSTYGDHLHNSKENNQNDSTSLFSNSTNKIFYGAPGTGKSYKVNNILQNKDDKTHRVTFHPEYDYASFIGGYKPTMEEEDSKEVIKYKFVPQAFTNIYVKAWNDPNNTYYLVIEEINRGNCAEIFGDIFQLLDRDSDYSITPSIELEDYLKTSLVDKDKGLKNGKLKLPRNLNIYATMNTSDQSLFPMDSAFKRRWDWEYIPICYEELTDEGKPNPSFNYVVDLDSHNSFKWNEFISKVNLNHIQQNPVLGMDKCIGNYFVIPKNGGKTIDVTTFINKAIFYLWNDVFKDEKNEMFEENSSYEDFFPIKSKGVQKLKELLERIGVNINTKSEDIAPEEDEVTS